MNNRNLKNKSKGPMGRGFGIAEKPKNFKITMKKLIKYLKPQTLSIIIVLIFAIGSAAFSIVCPKILGKATTKIFEGLLNKVSKVNGVSMDFSYIGHIMLLLLGLYILSSVFSFLQGFIMSSISQKVSFKMRKEISEKINRMPLKYFDSKSNGEVLSVVTNDVDTISQTLSQSMSQIITAITTIVGVIIMMFSISWIMALISILILPLSMVFILFIVKKSQKYFKDQQRYLGKVNGHVEETFSGQNIIKVFNGEDKVIDEFNNLNEHLYNSAWKSQFLSGMMMPIMTFIGNLGYVIVSILGGVFTIKNIINVGDILAFVQYMRSFNQPIAQSAQIANIFQSTAASAERVFEFLEEKEEIDEEKRAVDNNIKGKVEFENISFGYNDNKIIINDFSLNVPQGQKVAIVGPTGAGKTTIVKLLMRFYDVNKGRILIDGNNIKDFKRKDLRNIFGMVLQDTWLFNGSIMENIRYGRLGATDNEVIDVAKAANVHHFIKTLPDGYNMILNEDANNVSQGQKQLLTIARAMLSNPKILILDEATSSVDTRTELLIQKAMESLMKGKTSFIIAHRLSTIKDADLILAMKDGDIVEKGTHDELIKANGFYASLYNSQFKKSKVS